MKRSAEDEEDECPRSKRDVKPLLTDVPLPTSINYWMTTESKHDCFFQVGQEDGSVERIGAIKVFLFGQSEVLRKMLDESECALAETGDVRVPDCDPGTFKNFLVCVYGGTDILLRKLPFEESVKLLYLCEKYLLLELKVKISSCILELHQPLSFDNAVTALLHPACLNSGSLAEAVSRIVQNNTDKFLNDKPLQDLEPNAVAFIAQQKISVKEVDLWCAVLKWAKKRVGCEKECLRACVKKIFEDDTVYYAMTSHEFCRSVVREDILTSDEVAEICKILGDIPDRKDECPNYWSQFHPPKKEFSFVHVVNFISTFSGYDESLVYEFLQFKWWVKWSETENKDATKIYLYCSPAQNRSTPWKCDASGELEIVNHIDRARSMRRRINARRFAGHQSKVCYTLPTLTWFTEIEQGFVKNNCIEIKVRVEIE